MSTSRRDFLKLSLAATVGAGAAAVPQPARAASSQELCTVFDLQKCIGCEECVAACRQEWQETIPVPGDIPKPFPPRVPIEDWSHKKDVSDRLTPYNFLYLEHLDFQYQGQDQELHIPRRCMHCQNPPCADLCPWGAARVQTNGVVSIDDQLCLGGNKCKQVCPWHVPQRQSGVGLYMSLLPSYAGNGVMFKCKRCLPLLEKGETPRCIAACPNQVQTIGPRDQQVALATAMAQERAQADGRSASDWPAYVYGLTDNGGTNTIYVSPVPFDVVAQAIEADHQERLKDAASHGQGKGQKGGGKASPMGSGLPHMKRVADTMASEKNLTAALVLAPVAGVAGKFLGLWAKGKKALEQNRPEGGDHA